MTTLDHDFKPDYLNSEFKDMSFGFSQDLPEMEIELERQLKRSGHIRLAGFSSIMHSILIPKLAPFQIKNPGLSIEYNVYEVIDLLNVLKRGEADMVVTDYVPMESGVESIQIGEEEFVLIQAKKHSKPLDIFLDCVFLRNWPPIPAVTGRPFLQ